MQPGSQPWIGGFGSSTIYFWYPFFGKNMHWRHPVWRLVPNPPDPQTVIGRPQGSTATCDDGWKSSRQQRQVFWVADDKPDSKTDLGWRTCIIVLGMDPTCFLYCFMCQHNTRQLLDPLQWYMTSQIARLPCTSSTRNVPTFEVPFCHATLSPRHPRVRFFLLLPLLPAWLGYAYSGTPRLKSPALPRLPGWISRGTKKYILYYMCVCELPRENLPLQACSGFISSSKRRKETTSLQSQGSKRTDAHKRLFTSRFLRQPNTAQIKTREKIQSRRFIGSWEVKISGHESTWTTNQLYWFCVPTRKLLHHSLAPFCSSNRPTQPNSDFR